MRYREYRPVNALLPYVDCFWHFHTYETNAGAVPVQRCLPLGTLEIIFHIDHKPCMLLGPSNEWTSTPSVYCTGLYTDTVIWKGRPDSFMFGIRLRPESLIEMFKIPASGFFNDIIEVQELMGNQVNDLKDAMSGVFDPLKLCRIASEHLLKKLSSLKKGRSYVAEACRLIRNSNGSLSLEAIAEKIYISKRQLQRGFKDQFGASPKTFQRIIRFRTAYQYVREQRPESLKWTDVSYETGYADQAHFIRDFREFTGEVPTTLSQRAESFFQTLESTPRISIEES